MAITPSLKKAKGGHLVKGWLFKNYGMNGWSSKIQKISHHTSLPLRMGLNPQNTLSPLRAFLPPKRRYDDNQDHAGHGEQ
jgi:hypothetical protein